MIIFLLCEPLVVAEGFMLELVILELLKKKEKKKMDARRRQKVDTVEL